MMDFILNQNLDVFNYELLREAEFSENYEMPKVRKVDFKPSEAIPFNFATQAKNYNQWIHFYIYDYLFERVWRNFKRYLPILYRFQGVFTPDYSLYREMPLAMQIWNTYRNRTLAYWFQKQGIRIIPNIRWGDERTYAFVFEGYEKGGTFSVGTNGCIETKSDRHYFKQGLEKMVDVLQPDVIINYYGKPNDIFRDCEKQGIEVISLNYWREALRKVTL